MAQDLFEKNTFIELTKIDDIVLFDKKLKELENDLNKYWKRKNGVKLRLCYAYKLIDLLFKMLPLYKNFTKEEKGKLLKFLHVPLDKYTLNAIRIIWNKRIMNKKMVTKKIPLIPSMSFIGDDYDLYLEIQKVIRESIINAYPIEFDLAVWNRTTEDFKFALVERKTT